MKALVIRVQKGYFLPLSMLLLILLTGLAVTQVSMNSSQTHIVTNATDMEICFEKTEAALNQAINYLLSGSYSASDFLQNSKGLYIYAPSAAPLWTTVNWSSTTEAIQSFQGGSGTQASYIIEQLPSVVRPGQNMKTPTYIYRVTARAANSSGNAAVLLQNTIQIQE